ncbi:hypothetical protein SKAU_G00095280 [Synaphobranchus kaupii]|uniref:Uncharacterized protein n=1 Tax=Synaphobranchus kaupii TaxID=118154 RepID=A0A9Q1FXH2_SYNKA|nr:hypothetical protein SKAU_G00095280 [Synaphobranchus kaupii]
MTIIDPGDMRDQLGLALEEVSPGVVEVSVGQVHTSEAPPLREVGVRVVTHKAVELVEDRPSWGWDPQKWVTIQDSDLVLARVRYYVSQDSRPRGAERRDELPEVQQLLRQWSRFRMGCLCGTYRILIRKNCIGKSSYLTARGEPCGPPSMPRRDI